MACQTSLRGAGHLGLGLHPAVAVGVLVYGHDGLLIPCRRAVAGWATTARRWRPAARGVGVVVAGDELGDGVREVAGEGGAVGRGSEPNIGVDGKGRQVLVGAAARRKRSPTSRTTHAPSAMR